LHREFIAQRELRDFFFALPYFDPARTATIIHSDLRLKLPGRLTPCYSEATSS